MNDNDIWYSSTLGYEGAGTGSNVTEVFNAIQKLLKLYAPTSGTTPTMMIGNKSSSFNVDTQLTHIEQTFAIKIKESMVKVLETAMQAFFANNPLTKDNNTYRIFSQGQAFPVTKSLKYLTQSSAIAEAQREIAGRMATIYTQGGTPYITALGSSPDEAALLSKRNGITNIIPGAYSIQRNYNLEMQAKAQAKEAELERKRLAKEAAEEAKRLAEENAQLIASTEAARPEQDAARARYYRKRHGARYHAWKSSMAEQASEQAAARDEEAKRTAQAELEIHARRSSLYGKLYGAEAKEAYYEEQHGTRLAEHEAAEEAARISWQDEHNKKAKDLLYARRIVVASQQYRHVQDFARQVYEQEQHDARQYQYDWRKDAVDNALSRAIASEEEDTPTSKGSRKGRNLKIFANQSEQHRDNLRIFGRIAGSIAILVSIASKILSAIGNLYKAAGEAGVETFTSARTARNLGISPFDLHRYSNFAIEQNLDKDIFTRAFSSLGGMLGDPLASGTYDIFKNAGFDVVLGQGIDELINTTFKGGSADQHAKTILDAYLKWYKSGRLLNGDTADDLAVRKQLFDSLASVSPELAEIFGAAIDRGAFSFDDFLATSRKPGTSYTSSDNKALQSLGEAIGKFNAFWDETKLNVFSEIAGHVKTIVSKVEAILMHLNKDAKYTNTVSAFLANKEAANQAATAYQNVEMAAYAELVGKADSSGHIFESIEDVQARLPGNALVDFLLGSTSTSMRQKGYLLQSLIDFAVDARERAENNKLTVIPFDEAYIAKKATDKMQKTSDTFEDLVLTGVAPETALAAQLFEDMTYASGVTIPSFAKGTFESRAGRAFSEARFKKFLSGVSMPTLSMDRVAGMSAISQNVRDYYEKNIKGKSIGDSISELSDLADFMLLLSLNPDEVFGGQAYSGGNDKARAEAATSAYTGLRGLLNHYLENETIKQAVEQGVNIQDVDGIITLPGFETGNPKLYEMIKYQFPNLKSEEAWREEGVNLMKGNKVSMTINIDNKKAFEFEGDFNADTPTAILDDYQNSDNFSSHLSGSVSIG